MALDLDALPEVFRTLGQLRARNAFVDPVEADAAGMRLVLPR